MKALIDNDVLLKGSEYGLLPHFVAAIPGDNDPIGVLGAARYVVSNQLVKRSSAEEQDQVIAKLHEFLARNIELEPTPEEQLIASGIELDVECQQVVPIES